MTGLENYCIKLGPGVSYLELDILRNIAKRPGIEERHLASGGYSYFPVGASTRGRLLKIAEVRDRLYIEFNVDIEFINEIKDIANLSDLDRRELHAGGVKFCYVGSDTKIAGRLINEVITDYLTWYKKAFDLST